MSLSAPARERLTLALAAVAVLATRLPWIGSGYGSDPDGYRVVIVARQIARSGLYEASRLPGFPAYEYLTALSAWSAPWVSNLVTALFSVASFVLFAVIARELGVRRYVLIALAFAMTPVVYLSSSLPPMRCCVAGRCWPACCWAWASAAASRPARWRCRCACGFCSAPRARPGYASAWRSAAHCC
jgi:hypothetical protein